MTGSAIYACLKILAFGHHKETPQISIDTSTWRLFYWFGKIFPSRNSYKPKNKSWVLKNPCLFSVIHSFSANPPPKKKQKTKQNKQTKKPTKEDNKWMGTKRKKKWPNSQFLLTQPNLLYPFALKDSLTVVGSLHYVINSTKIVK